MIALSQPARPLHPLMLASALLRRFRPLLQQGRFAATCLVLGVMVCGAWSAASAQSGDWTWISGSSTVPSVNVGQPGVYGTLGTPAAANTPGGRSDAESWTDNSGNFWLLGGIGVVGVGGGYPGDLWEFSPSTNEWTWMGGAGNVNQTPVYGTLGTPAAGNFPGGRSSALTWTDSSGNLWLFGGDGRATNSVYGYFNDLWMFNPSTGNWTWVGGSQNVNQSGVYGTLGTPAAGNVPGSRYFSTTWTDNSGNLWLFGGYGYDSTGNVDRLNDLWKFNPSSNQWTWIGGSSTVDQYGFYGIQGTPAVMNIPGSRDRARGWTDSSGNLWLFGGDGNGNYGYSGYLNDLWEYNPTTSEWAWMGGSSMEGQSGTYGTLGTPATTNIPGARVQPATWVDSSGNFWLLGGRRLRSQRRFWRLRLLQRPLGLQSFRGRMGLDGWRQYAWKQWRPARSLWRVGNTL